MDQRQRKRRYYQRFNTLWRYGETVRIELSYNSYSRKKK